jgi:hypothetical protein
MRMPTIAGSTLTSSRLWPVLPGACGLSLAGSLWALLVPPECESCRSAAALLGGVNLAALGIAFYALLLTGLILNRSSRWVVAGIFAAAGVHGVLLALLLFKRLFCPACLVTASGAITMAVVALAVYPRRFRRLVIILPLTAGLAMGGKLLLRSLQVDPETLAQKHVLTALQREEKDPPVERGTVRVLVYSRPTCPHCRQLDRQIMPVIRREFDRLLRVERRPAWKGLPTPTLIIRGERRTHLVGVRNAEALRTAIRFAQGNTVTHRPSGRGHG